MPAVGTGTTTRTNARRRDSPSIIAASSMSRGIDLKKPIISQVQNGTVKFG